MKQRFLATKKYPGYEVYTHAHAHEETHTHTQTHFHSSRLAAETVQMIHVSTYLHHLSVELRGNVFQTL